jgi:hypothetical protein
METKSLSPLWSDLLSSINKMLTTQINGILVNKYIDGNDYIAAHSDYEPTTHCGILHMGFKRYILTKYQYRKK